MSTRRKWSCLGLLAMAIAVPTLAWATDGDNAYSSKEGALHFSIGLGTDLYSMVQAKVESEHGGYYSGILDDVGSISFVGAYSPNGKHEGGIALSFGADGSHYTLRYAYQFGRAYGPEDPHYNSAFYIGIPLHLIHVNNYFEEGEEGDVSWGFRTGNSATFVLPSLLGGYRFYILERLVVDAYISVPMVMLSSVCLSYRF